MDTKERITDQYGRFDGDPQNNANGFYWGLDNRMYTAGQASIQLRLKDGVFEVQETLPRGEWGVTQDDAGRTYRNTNESALHVDLVRRRTTHGTQTCCGRAAATNVSPTTPPNSIPSGQSGPIQVPTAPISSASIATTDRWRGLPLSVRRWSTAAIGYRANSMAMSSSLNLQLIWSAGSSCQTTGRRCGPGRRTDRGEFLASTDERFRPVYLTNAPDGTLYHSRHVSRDHRASHLGHGISQGSSRGSKAGPAHRVWTDLPVVHDSTRLDSSNPFSHASPQQLVAALAHPNGWRRDTAQRLLVERGVRTVVPDLVKLATNAPDWRTRLHALWALDGLDAIRTRHCRDGVE